MSKPLQNFHVPLPAELYRDLRAEAQRLKVPATVLAREAIAVWVAEHQRQLRAQEITAWAQAVAGTELDLDAELEAAGIEHLLESERV